MRMKIKILFVTCVLITVDNFVETCKVNEFQCSDGNCIPIAKKCNYDFDCPDHSDEIICPTVQTCPEGLSRCSSGICVVHQSECSTSANFGNHTSSENKSGNGLESFEIVIIIGAGVCFLLLILIIIRNKMCSK